MSSRPKTAMVGMIVTQEVAETDSRISIAGNRFQEKLINSLRPDYFINISPPFLDGRTCATGLVSNEIVLNSQLSKIRLIRIFTKVIGDAIKFFIFAALKPRMKIVFYNIDYTNIMLVLLARLLFHETYVVAADFARPPKNLYEHYILLVYSKLTGVISLRQNTNLNKNIITIPAIIDSDINMQPKFEPQPIVLLSGSLGETTGLFLAIGAACRCPQIELLITGRPYLISEKLLKDSIADANAKGAKITYLGTLAFEEYTSILAGVSITLSLRNPADSDHNNNFPSKIAEYMSAGKVVISSLTYKELPDDTYITTQYHERALAENLNLLANDKKLLHSIATRAHKYVSSNFTQRHAEIALRQFLNPIRKADQPQCNNRD